jgi:hypothetical protein
MIQAEKPGDKMPSDDPVEQPGNVEAELQRQLAAHRRRAPDPPIEQRALIGPAEIEQMRERKKQLQALRERFGGGNG